MPPVQQQKKPAPKQGAEIESAKKVATSFTAAFKYYSLYPEGHAFSAKYLAKFKIDLDQFLAEYKNLRLDVSRNSLLYKGDPVFTGFPEKNNPAYLLSRDRLLFLEFRKQIETTEISLLLDILKRHRNPTENTDSDIATTLWHYRFDHMHYEAADMFAMEAIEFELSMFKAAPYPRQPDGRPGLNGTTGHDNSSRTSPPGISSADPQPAANRGMGGTGDERDAGGSEKITVDTDAPSSLLVLAENKNLAELDQEEQQWLEFIIRQEEDRDSTSDVLDILLITLAVEGNEIDFAAILEFLEFEFFDAMAKQDFTLAFKIVKNVHNIGEAIKSKKPWARSLINLFFAGLARENHLEELPWLDDYARITDNPGENLELLNTLQYLGPEIILTLGKLLIQARKDNIHLRLKISGLIAAKAKENPAMLCKLIAESGEETNQLLLPVIEELENDHATKAYLQMTHHPAPEIRKSGMDGFFRTAKNPQAHELAHLLQDRDKQLRERMLSYMEQRDDSLREELLLSFLTLENPPVNDELHIMHCYRLLSTCASPGSTAFLQRILLESDLKSMFSHLRKAHKNGAAYALRVMNTPETRQILQTGAGSMRPDVRQICKKVLEL